MWSCEVELQLQMHHTQFAPRAHLFASIRGCSLSDIWLNSLRMTNLRVCTGAELQRQFGSDTGAYGVTTCYCDTECDCDTGGNEMLYIDVDDVLFLDVGASLLTLISLKK
jgi:hypothetical protein